MLIAGAAIAGWSATIHANDVDARSPDPSRATMQSLDGEVQEIKTELLGIAAELSQLEERLLFPSGTQVAVFVSLAADDSFRLDALRVHIDGELAAHLIYSFKELDALHGGGMQRIFTGNVAAGEHYIEVAMAGKLANGTDYVHSDRFKFEKGVDPRLLGISLTGPGTGEAAIQLRDL
jgi:hypothetical protein